jgi:hypothetical protein
MIFIRKEYSHKEQNIYCSNECFNNSDEYKKYDKDYARFQCFYEIYTSENYPNFITDFLSDDYIEYCSTCGTIINEQNQVNKSIEIIDKKIFSEENQALLGKHIDYMREQLIDEDIINFSEEFYDGVNDLYKEFMQKTKEYKENK